MKRAHLRIVICVVVSGIWGAAACTVPSGMTPPPITLADSGESYEVADAPFADSEGTAILDGEASEAAINDAAIVSDAVSTADTGALDAGADAKLDSGVVDSGVADTGVADTGVADTGADTGIQADASDGG